ncbi:MAG: outer membrane protein transport protein [Deltaproteobacteria bacterium]|nr:outer membrane protein transport protein [Deltaproteobacteria bacterium]
MCRRSAIRLLPACAGIALLLLAPAKSRAAGYYLPDRGVRAMSRGGAFVAGCDDGSALWYNPAALAGQKGTRLHLDMSLIWYQMHFERYPVPELGTFYEPVANAAPPLPDPSIAVSSDLGLDDFVFALGAYGPYTGLNRYPEGGAQRYALVRADNLGYFLEAAAAWQPVEGMRIGAGLALISLMINNTQAASSFPGVFGGPEQPDQDGLVQYVARDDFIPSAIAGVWIAPGAWWPALRGIELGLSFMSGFSIDAHGTLRSRLPDHYYYDGVSLDPEQPPVSTRFDFPWVVRAGLRYRDPGDRFDVELAFVWEGWSCFDTIEIETDEPAYYRNVPTIGDYLVLPMILGRHYEDTWSLRLGGSYRPLDWLVIRIGTYYEKGAVPDAYYTVASPDADKWALCAGAGALWNAFELDLGYMHVFQLDRDIPVAASQAVQVNPSNPEGTVTIGGGQYRSSYDLLGFSVLVRFDAWF